MRESKGGWVYAYAPSGVPSLASGTKKTKKKKRKKRRRKMRRKRKNHRLWREPGEGMKKEERKRR